MKIGKQLLLATGNAGKVRELNQLLDGLPVNLMSLNDFPAVSEVPETGMTFRENAGLKAVGYARQTGIPALADDSGLEISALGGIPGVLSARYLGEAASFEERMARILADLERSSYDDRSARFVCAVTFALPTGDIVDSAEGICSGTLASEPRGTFGFGYDPIFIPEGFDATFGELGDNVKRSVSHRARALFKIIPYLRDFYSNLT